MILELVAKPFPTEGKPSNYISAQQKKKRGKKSKRSRDKRKQKVKDKGQQGSFSEILLSTRA